VVVVLLLEAGTRSVGLRFPAIEQPGVSDRGLWVYDARKGWFHAPGSHGRTFLGGPDQGDVRINSLGLRGPDVQRRKDAGVFRILVFGDSFVFGVGVSEEHSLTSQLARLLQRPDAAPASGRRFEVINMGVSGYSTDQEYLLFEHVGADLHPDLVLLFSVDNDFAGNAQDFAYHAHYKPYFAQEPDGSLTPRNMPVPTLGRWQQVKLWLGRESNVWNAFRSRRADSAGVQRFLDLFQVAVPRTTTEDQVGLMHSLLRTFRSRAEALNAGFVMFNTGHRGERTPLFQSLRPRLRRDGFHFLGLEGTMGEARARQPDRHWDFGHDTHWNVASHRLAAEVTNEYLRRSGLVPAPSASGIPSHP
jgi:hypothetical protein